MTSSTASESQPPVTMGTQLSTGTLGLGGVLMQAIAQISPTLGIFYTIAFTSSQAGVTAPLTYLAAFAICLTLAAPMLGLARHLPSAGASTPTCRPVSARDRGSSPGGSTR
ncbi:hypothetical protein [Rathayibacter sp. AY2B7]|uniref:hypothetical protein n=1 Tax=Rathayibacter sp. AY2B7 TaxID=2080571 RepID=UPI0015E2857D|nr:hypothetical protein [Rathayibacter sp. AY2B7]